MSFNKVILTGNLTKDCEMSQLPNGTNICKFRLASSRKYKDANGQQQEKVAFVDISVFGNTADICVKYLGKGSSVLVEGRLEYDQWEDKQSGEKRSKLYVVAETIQFIGAKKDNQQAPQQQGYNQPQQQNGYYQQQQAPQQQQQYYQAPPQAPQPPQQQYYQPQQQQQQQYYQAPQNGVDPRFAPPPVMPSANGNGALDDIPF